ncbi:MAG TPA: tRNA (N6-isopentenyl adenosine(37)-C2)-methylthiotransferase MiaB [Planctomycetota bacterium]|nr:tRNA (N6-isopentenyl adenosine(37)-C2)-methylthiotransferase MiaB [Planctomycetota bacterium]
MNDAVLSPPPQGTPGGPRVLLEVFGCQMNKLDSELMVGALRRAGYDFTDSDEDADAVLLVTCAIRDQAENRVHSHLGELALMKRRRPELALGVLGCMAQREGSELLARWPALDFVAGTRDFPRVASLLDEVRADRTRVLAIDGDPAVSEARDLSARPDRARAYVTVMRGCDKPCTYCVVPNTRGAEVSRPMADVLAEVAALVDDGVREVTLLGQTVNAWGRTEGRSLGELLFALQELPDLKRVRFITSHPEEMDEPLIAAMAACPKVGRFLHLPPQSGSTRVLRRMARGYTAERYRELVARLRDAIPGVELGADFIVGFPGETDADFERTMELAREVAFSQAFAFRYSPRPGTPAWGRLHDDVPDAVKRERLLALQALQNDVQRVRHARLVGQVHEVLVEGGSRRDERRLFGRNLAFDRVVFEGPAELVDRFVPVAIESATAVTLAGRWLPAPAARDAGARDAGACEPGPHAAEPSVIAAVASAPRAPESAPA